MRILNSLKIHRGFTLLEIMVTIIIIGVIAVIAIPRFNYAVEKTKSAEGVHILESLREAQKAYYFEHESYANSLEGQQLEIDPNDFVSKNFNTPEISNDSNKVASIKRNESPGYILSIDEAGNISCSAGSSDICKKIGY